MIARAPFQELPLLPGEYEYLASHDWLDQFGDHDHKVIEFPIDGHVLTIESVVSRKPNCACNHDTRPTICRLYPLLPRFDVVGRLVGAEPMGIFEEMEQIAGLPPACQVNTLPFAELNKFLGIVEAIGERADLLFYLEAYRRTKRHVSQRLETACASGRDVFSVFEAYYIRRKLVDGDMLRAELSQLASKFEDHYGNGFLSKTKLVNK